MHDIFHVPCFGSLCHFLVLSVAVLRMQKQREAHLHVAPEQVDAVHRHLHRLVRLHAWPSFLRPGTPLLSRQWGVWRQPQVCMVPLLQPPEVPALPGLVFTMLKMAFSRKARLCKRVSGQCQRRKSCGSIPKMWWMHGGGEAVWVTIMWACAL